MAGETDRVCPRCGTAAGENEYCSKCGLHLAEQPELPTREQWEAREADRGASPVDELAAGPPVSAAGTQPPTGPTSGSDDSSSPAGPGGRLRDRWNALSTTAKRSILAGTGVVVAVVIVLIVTTSGGGSRASSNTGNSGSNSGNTGNVVSDAQTCASRWDSEASQLEKQEAGQFATGYGSSTGRAAAGYEASSPGSCLITVGNGNSSTTGAFMQFNESAGVFSQGATGVDQQLPGNWVWNASIDSSGNITPGGTGNTGTGTTSTSGNTGNTGGGTSTSG